MGDDIDTSSCWSITGWALVGLAAVIAIAFVIGLNSPSDIANITAHAG